MDKLEYIHAINGLCVHMEDKMEKQSVNGVAKKAVC